MNYEFLIPLVGSVTLNAQILLAAEPGVVLVIAALSCMTAYAGQHLTGSRVKNLFTDGMGKYPMLPMALPADIVDRGLEHDRLIRPVRCMAVIAGAGNLVAMLGRFPPLDSRTMTGATNMHLFSPEQPFIVTGVRGMASHTAVFTKPNQVIMGGSHLFTDIRMALKTDVPANRLILAGMAIPAVIRVGFMQDIADQVRTIAAVRAVTSQTFPKLGREIRMFLLQICHLMAPKAKRLRILDQQIVIGGLVWPMTGKALPFGKGRMGMLELFGQLAMTVETDIRKTVFE